MFEDLLILSFEVLETYPRTQVENSYFAISQDLFQLISDIPINSSSSYTLNNLVATHGLFEFLQLQKYSTNLQKRKLILSKQLEFIFGLVENTNRNRFAQTADQGFHDVLSVQASDFSDIFQVPYQ